MSLPRLLLVAAAVLCLAAVAPAQLRRAAAEQAPEPQPPLEWSELLARDARVQFLSPPTDAQADLDSLDLPTDEQDLALFALGAGGALQDWPRLFSHANEGEPHLRRAAILGMGELHIGVEEELAKILAEDREPFASDALLALARTGRVSARKRVEAVAGAEGPRAQTAAAALRFAIDPTGSQEFASARYLLELRWRSAIRYGTIDGQTWDVQLLARLTENEDFLDHLVLRYSAELPGIGVRDHLLNSLVTRGGRAPVRACVRAMPEQLAQLMYNELWKPADDAEWDAMLRELERNEDMLSDAAGLLEAAYERSPYRARALRLMAVARNAKAAAAILGTFDEYSGEDRVFLLSGLAHFDDPSVLDFLRGLKEDEDPRVVAQALVGRARGKDETATEQLRSVLSVPEHPDWVLFLEMCCHHADSPKIQAILEAQLPQMQDRARILIASALSLQGRLGARAVLRSSLEDGLPRGILGGYAARALSHRPSSEDMDLMRQLFPLEDRDAENLELCLGLLRLKERAEVKQILQAALWRDPFDRSVLSALLIVESGNWLALKGELDNVPQTASTRDLRRVGFACGEWGGYPLLEWLEGKRKQGSADPVLQGALLGMLSTRTH